MKEFMAHFAFGTALAVMTSSPSYPKSPRPLAASEGYFFD
jgi:hypothetical protein